MVANRGRDTKPELRLRHALWAAGIRGFRVNYLVGRTKVDVAYPPERVAVMVNGCFWHSCPVCRLPMPKTHSEFWGTKFRLTRQRDARMRSQMRQDGWILVELWEHQIRDGLRDCVTQVADTVALRNSLPKLNNG